MMVCPRDAAMCSGVCPASSMQLGNARLLNSFATHKSYLYCTAWGEEEEEEKKKEEEEKKDEEEEEEEEEEEKR